MGLNWSKLIKVDGKIKPKEQQINTLRTKTHDQTQGASVRLFTDLLIFAKKGNLNLKITPMCSNASIMRSYPAHIRPWWVPNAPPVRSRCILNASFMRPKAFPVRPQCVPNASKMCPQSVPSGSPVHLIERNQHQVISRCFQKVEYGKRLKNLFYTYYIEKAEFKDRS